MAHIKLHNKAFNFAHFVSWDAKSIRFFHPLTRRYKAGSFFFGFAFSAKILAPWCHHKYRRGFSKNYFSTMAILNFIALFKLGSFVLGASLKFVGAASLAVPARAALKFFRSSFLQFRWVLTLSLGSAIAPQRAICKQSSALL